MLNNTDVTKISIIHRYLSIIDNFNIF